MAFFYLPIKAGTKKPAANCNRLDQPLCQLKSLIRLLDIATEVLLIL